MKKTMGIIICALILTLCACGGKTSEGKVSGVKESEIKTHHVDSEIFSDQDINDAIKVIEDEFQADWKGCTLKEIYYAGDEVTKNNVDTIQDYDADEVIVLMSNFDVDQTGADESLDPGSTYEDWNWILVRKNGGKWQHVDHGY